MQEINLTGVLSIGGNPAVIEPKTITENGTYTAPSGVDGYNPITVNVPTGDLVTSFVINNTVFNQGGSSISYNVESISTLWGGSSNIGCCINFQTPFENKNKIIVDIGVYGESYQHLNNVSTRNFNTAIGVTDNVQSTYIDLTNLDINNHLLADVEFNGIDNYGLTNIHREVDISSIIDTPMYLFLQIPGVTLTNLSVRIV